MLRCLAAVSLLILAAFAMAGDTLRPLLPGDRVIIECQQESSVCVTRTVGNDGTISVPGLGEVVAVTKTPEFVAQSIAALLVDSGVCPVATVVVRSIPSRRGAISVSGMVESPLELTPKGRVHLKEVAQWVHPTEVADLEHVQILDARGQLISVNVTRDDLELRPGDRVIFRALPGGTSVIVVGGVGHPGPIPYRVGLTLSDALRAAGGVSGHGDANKVRVHRGADDIPLDVALDGGFRLQASDAVTVELARKRLFVAVIGAVRKAGLVEYKEGIRISEAITVAGGAIRSRFPMFVTVKHLNGKSGLRVALGLVIEGKEHDSVLAPGDSIEISEAR